MRTAPTTSGLVPNVLASRTPGHWVAGAGG